MSYRTFEHTADVGVEAEADELSELFAETARGLFEVIRGGADVEDRTTEHVEVDHARLERALMDFLDEFLFLQDAEGLVFADVSDVSVEARDDGWHVEATVHGEPFDREKHKGCVHVKAITFHEFGLEPPEDDTPGKSRVILDI